MDEQMPRCALCRTTHHVGCWAWASGCAAPPPEAREPVRRAEPVEDATGIAILRDADQVDEENTKLGRLTMAKRFLKTWGAPLVTMCSAGATCIISWSPPSVLFVLLLTLTLPLLTAIMWDLDASITEQQQELAHRLRCLQQRIELYAGDCDPSDDPTNGRGLALR